MSRESRVVDRRTINNPAIKCLTCCVAQKLNPGSIDVQDAVTWVPVWRTQAVNGQMMMGLAIEPICLEHLTVEQQTAVDRGQLVDGSNSPPMPDPQTLARINEALRQGKAAGLIP